MTIAVGVLATDGIVLAADTQLTAPTVGWKGEGGKIMAVARSMRDQVSGAIAVTGATAIYEYLHGLGDELWKDFEDSLDESDKREAYGRFKNIVYEFNEEHVMPWADRPEINVIIGYQRDGQLALWQSNRGVLIEQYDHAAVGIGSLAASAWLNRVWKRGLDVSTAIAVATFATAVAKDSVDGCGKYTNVLVIEADRWRRIDQSIINEIDRLYEAWASEISPALLLDCFGEAPHKRTTMSRDDLKTALGTTIQRLRDAVPDEVRQWRAAQWERLVAERVQRVTKGISTVQPPLQE